MTAGPHVVGVSFVRELWEPEGLPQPLQRGRVLTNDQIYMGYASVGSVQIGGPYTVDRTGKGHAEPPRDLRLSTPRRHRGTPCASTILSRIARLAYRRPVTKADVQTLLEFFDRGRRDGGSFDAGIQFALERVLVDPDFLLRVHRDPRAGPRRHRLSDLEVASRLSFFLWSSIPTSRCSIWPSADELTKPAILEQQVRRMLADPRATRALVDDFAAQWLNLRRVDEVVVDPDRYPTTTTACCRRSSRRPSSSSPARCARIAAWLDLLRADYTFVNERLARHYGIPGIYGSRFRRVTLPNPDQRGGLLAHGALLATTSYPDRTSPVLRGKWLLEQHLRLPVPPPPPACRHHADRGQAGRRAADHSRAAGAAPHQSVCASCHSVIDPLGFALENFDAIGGWRTLTNRAAGRCDGTTASGAKVEGLAGLRALLLAQPEQFPRPVTEKLLAYALGRRLEYYDRPAVREDRARRGGGELSLVVAHSGHREESGVLDASISP